MNYREAIEILSTNIHLDCSLADAVQELQARTFAVEQLERFEILENAIKEKDLISRKEVCQILHELGGCDAKPGSWSDGWDRAIAKAISQVETMWYVTNHEAERIMIDFIKEMGEHDG